MFFSVSVMCRRVVDSRARAVLTGCVRGWWVSGFFGLLFFCFGVCRCWIFVVLALATYWFERGGRSRVRNDAGAEVLRHASALALSHAERLELVAFAPVDDIPKAYERCPVCETAGDARHLRKATDVESLRAISNLDGTGLGWDRLYVCVYACGCLSVGASVLVGR